VAGLELGVEVEPQARPHSAYQFFWVDMIQLRRQLRSFLQKKYYD
jgi:hypothetical protein